MKKYILPVALVLSAAYWSAHAQKRSSITKPRSHAGQCEQYEIEDGCISKNAGVVGSEQCLCNGNE